MSKANISWLVGVDLLTSVYFSIIYSYYFSFSFIFGLLGLVVKNKNKECYSVMLYNTYLVLDPLTKWMILMYYLPSYYKFLVSCIILGVQTLIKIIIFIHLYCIKNEENDE